MKNRRSSLDLGRQVGRNRPLQRARRPRSRRPGQGGKRHRIERQERAVIWIGQQMLAPARAGRAAPARTGLRGRAPGSKPRFCSLHNSRTDGRPAMRSSAIAWARSRGRLRPAPTGSRRFSAGCVRFRRFPPAGIRHRNRRPRPRCYIQQLSMGERSAPSGKWSAAAAFPPTRMSEHDIGREPGGDEVGGAVEHLSGAAAFQVEAARERMGGGDVPVTDYVFQQLDARHRLRCVRGDGGDLDVRPPARLRARCLNCAGKLL